MLETLKTCYKRPHTLTESLHYNLLDRRQMAKYRWELFPIVNEYYHEFNPFFVHAIPEENSIVFPAFKIFTVRDGYIAFADFLLKYWREIPKWKNVWIIPPSFAPLVPENLRDQFLCYTTSQMKVPDIKKAKTVTIFGILMDYYFGSYEAIEEKLQVLKDLPPEIKIEACLSMRRNPFLTSEKENYHWVKVPEIIRKVIPNREIHFVRMADFMERSTTKDQYLLDLKMDDGLTADSYLHFFYLGRGGVVGSIPTWDPKQKTLFDIDISFGQKFHVIPFPDVKSGFSELLFFQKTNKGEIWNLSAFHKVVRKILGIPTQNVIR